MVGITKTIGTWLSVICQVCKQTKRDLNKAGFARRMGQGSREGGHLDLHLITILEQSKLDC